jgi:hypothetical protein
MNLSFEKSISENYLTKSNPFKQSRSLNPQVQKVTRIKCI